MGEDYRGLRIGWDDDVDSSKPTTKETLKKYEGTFRDIIQDLKDKSLIPKEIDPQGNLESLEKLFDKSGPCRRFEFGFDSFSVGPDNKAVIGCRNLGPLSGSTYTVKYDVTPGQPIKFEGKRTNSLS